MLYLCTHACLGLVHFSTGTFQIHVSFITNILVTAFSHRKIWWILLYAHVDDQLSHYLATIPTLLNAYSTSVKARPSKSLMCTSAAPQKMYTWGCNWINRIHRTIPSKWYVVNYRCVWDWWRLHLLVHIVQQFFYSNETVATEWVGRVYVHECVYTSM